MAVIVSDHALIRWLHRVRGVDMEALRAELATIAQPFADVGARHAEIGGFWFVFLDGTLVTITPERPRLANALRNDRGGANGTHQKRQPLPWQAKKRRRDHR